METQKAQNNDRETFLREFLPRLATAKASLCFLVSITQLDMAGKRKRADTLGVGEVEEGQVNGGGQVNQHEKFREWLADVIEILKE